MSTKIITKIDSLTKRRIVEKIFNSSDFYQVPTYQNLLRYLIDASNRTDLKESTIAFEFFDKDATFDPALDSSVRAYVSNLRKKLEHYYLTEGQHDEIRITIPKGQYYVEFIQTNQGKEKAAPSKVSTKLPYFIFIPITFILLSIIISSRIKEESIDSQKVHSQKNDYLWNDWFYQNKKVLIVLGNYYFFEMPFEDGRYHFIRDQLINSDSDFEAFLEEYPSHKSQFSKTHNKYLDESIPFCLSYILGSFVLHNKDFKLKLSSEVLPEDIRNNNIIFIGPYKCLDIFKEITKDLHFEYHGESVTLNFYEDNSGDVLSFPFRNTGKEIRLDHAMVVKVAGMYNNEFIFFTSYHHFGNIAAVKLFTNPNSHEITKQLKSNYFEALFEIEGVNIARMDLNIKLLHYYPLDSDFKVGLGN